MWKTYYEMETAAGAADVIDSSINLFSFAIRIALLIIVIALTFVILLAIDVIGGIITAAMSIAESVGKNAKKPEGSIKLKSECCKYKLFTRVCTFRLFERFFDFTLNVWITQIDKIEDALWGDDYNILLKLIMVPALVFGCVILTLVTFGYLAVVGVRALISIMSKGLKNIWTIRSQKTKMSE